MMIRFLLDGEFSGIATEANPTISGEFAYSLTLPENLIDFELPVELPNQFDGQVSLTTSFDWTLFSIFTRVINLSATLTLDGEELLTLGPINFDLLPGGTFIFHLDRDE